MNGFYFHNPTKVYFGEGVVSKLGKELEAYGKNILMTYGGGSIKKNGIYDKVTDILKGAGKNVFELPGVMPNPRTEKVYEGIKICKEQAIDFILAIGGGSVIDCSKLIAAGARTDRDFWESFLIKKEKASDAVPLGSILTLAGTGSEMDCLAVITKWDAQIKTSWGSPLVQPKFAFLDPTYTYSLPKNQMVNGAVDTLSHLFEQYFSRPDTNNVSDDLAEALMKNVIQNLPLAVKNPEDYNARSNLMWDSTLALNTLVGLGKEQDWITHKIEHSLSAFYDVAHGAGLAVVHPNYMLYTYKGGLSKYVQYAKNVWGISSDGKTEDETALAGIRATRDFFKSVGAPSTLQELGIPESSIDAISENVQRYKTSYSDLTVADVKEILRLCLQS